MRIFHILSLSVYFLEVQEIQNHKVSSSLAISLPLNAKSRTFFILASPVDYNSLSNNEVLICLFSSLTDQLALIDSFS